MERCRRAAGQSRGRRGVGPREAPKRTTTRATALGLHRTPKRTAACPEEHPKSTKEPSFRCTTTWRLYEAKQRHGGTPLKTAPPQLLVRDVVALRRALCAPSHRAGDHARTLLATTSLPPRPSDRHYRLPPASDQACRARKPGPDSLAQAPRQVLARRLATRIRPLGGGPGWRAAWDRQVV